VHPHIYKALTYAPLQDFTPVATVFTLTFALAIGPMVPNHVKTLADFVQWCRANPRQATYGSPSAGSMPHFIGVMLARAAGVELMHVPYQGGAPAVQDLLGGQIASAIVPISIPLPYFQSGQLRALATTGPQQSSSLTDVPTIKDAGYEALETVEWC